MYYYVVCSIVIPILWMRKLGHKEDLQAIGRVGNRAQLGMTPESRNP